MAEYMQGLPPKENEIPPKEKFAKKKYFYFKYMMSYIKCLPPMPPIFRKKIFLNFYINDKGNLH